MPTRNDQTCVCSPKSCRRRDTSFIFGIQYLKRANKIYIGIISQNVAGRFADTSALKTLYISRASTWLTDFLAHRRSAVVADGKGSLNLNLNSLVLQGSAPRPRSYKAFVHISDSLLLHARLYASDSAFYKIRRNIFNCSFFRLKVAI